MSEIVSTTVASQARIAGLLYLIVIAGGFFAQVFVRGSLIVPGDAAATVRAIAADESLWRWGLAVQLVYLVAAVGVNVIIYGLFRSAGPTLARLAVVLSLVGVAIEVGVLLNLYVPLALLGDGGALGALGEVERQALSYLAIRLFSTGFGFVLLFFAGFCVLIGTLILRSRPVPRVIGALLIVAGISYAVNTLTMILAPELSDLLLPWILMPILPAELSLALWLLVKGVRVEVPEPR